MVLGNRVEAIALHVVNNLIGHFLKDLFGEVTLLHGYVVLDELDDIAGGFLTLAVAETLTVAIKFFHGAEIGPADTNDDDRARKVSKLDNNIYRFLHVMDSTISQEQQDLVGMRGHHRLNVITKLS